MITGGCLCGAVRYQVSGPPQYAVLCHCRDCQRASGTGHVPVMGMPKASFSVQGDTRGYTVQHGNGRRSTRYFCPTCGSLMYGTADISPNSVSIYVGSLDDPSIFRPAVAIFTQARHTWDITAGALPEFAASPSASGN